MNFKNDETVVVRLYSGCGYDSHSEDLIISAPSAW